MKNGRSEFESDFLSGRITFALVLRASYEEIQRLKQALLNDYECIIAYHEIANEKRYITDSPPAGVDKDGRGKNH